MKHTFREALDSDIPHIAGLNQSVQELHAELEPEIFHANLDSGRVEECFAIINSANVNKLYIAEVNQVVAGMAWAEIIAPEDGLFHKRQKTFYIHHLVVDQKYRRVGLGRDLLVYLREQADCLGCNRIGLDTWAKNTPAIEFFGSVGFETERIVFRLDTN